MYFINSAETTAKSILKKVSNYAENDSCAGAKSIINDCKASYGEYSKKFSPYWQLMNKSSKYPCSYLNANNQINNNCVYGDKSSTKMALAWGDSHIQYWVPALDKIFEKAHIKLLPVYSGGCAPWVLTSDDVPDGYYMCPKHNEIVLNSLLKNFDYVFIATRWVDSPSNDIEQRIGSSFGKLNETSLKMIVSKLKVLKIKTFYLQSSPPFKDNNSFSARNRFYKEGIKSVYHTYYKNIAKVKAISKNYIKEIAT